MIEHVYKCAVVGLSYKYEIKWDLCRNHLAQI